MMKIILLGLGLSTAIMVDTANAAGNPFLSPRERAPKAVLVEEVPEVSKEPVSETDKVEMTVNGKLIGIINGQEVWLRDDTQTYARLPVRKGISLNIKESPEQDSGR